MNPTVGWTIAGAAQGTSTSPLPTTTSQASLTADYLPIYSAALQGTYAINLANLLGISSQPVSINDPQTLTQKTLTSPAVNGMVLNGSVTGTYTLAGTPTLTAPTINSPTIAGGTLAMDTITGNAVSNTGSIFGIAVTTGQITTANSIAAGTIVQNGVSGSQLAANAITLGYAQLSGGTLTTTSTTAVQATGLTTTVTIPAGSRYVEIYVEVKLKVDTGVRTPAISIWDGTVGSGTQLNQSQHVIQNSNVYETFICKAVYQPAAGSKMYNVGWSSDGVGGVTTTMQTDNGANPFIHVKAV